MLRSARNAREAAMWWAAVIEPEDVHQVAIREALGDDEACRWALAPSPGPLPDSLGGRERGWDAAWERWHPRATAVDIDELIALTEKIGARFIIPADPEWPDELRLLAAHEPVGLWLLGTMPTRRGISLVGARACTPSGARIAFDMGAELAQSGVPIISGGAFGIDIAAHRGALAAGGSTLAIMAGGLAHLYPASHDEEFHRIIEAGGALISELPPLWRPAKWRFLGRNRIIAALGHASIVVEAGMRSGALATARRAFDVSRPVGAVPGPVHSAASAGCHDLIRNGATLIRDSRDAFELIRSGFIPDEETLFGAPHEEDTGVAALDPLMRRVWEAMPKSRGTGLDRITRASGMGRRDCLIALGQLELLGHVRADPDGWRRAH